MKYFIVSVIKREMQDVSVCTVQDGDVYSSWDAAKMQVDLLVKYNPDNHYAICHFDKAFTGIVEVVEG